MNFVILCVFLIISETNSYYISATKFHKDSEDQRVEISETQHFQDINPKNATEKPDWSEILAEAIVKRIFSFHKMNNETENLTSIEAPETSIWVRSVSCVLKLFKTYIYDPMFSYVETKVNIHNIYKNETDTKFKRNITENDPNNEVEIIEPKYHGKLCSGENCTESGEIEVNESACASGFERDQNGKCVDAKSSKFILSIPSQCPTGYRRDWLGFCRPTL